MAATGPAFDVALVTCQVLPEPDLDEVELPDLVGASLKSLLKRVDQIETSLTGQPSADAIRPSNDGVWSGLDFSI